MCEILIFGGTTEGRELALFSAENEIHVSVSVTTEYGADLLLKSRYIHVITGEKNSSDIFDFISSNAVKAVFDATHPYARKASENILDACGAAGISYFRVIRSESKKIKNAVYFDSFDPLVSYLNNRHGNIFITTGSKNLNAFTKLDSYSERCYVRILDIPEKVNECVSLGFDKSKIISGKGPFSEENNIMTINKISAGFVVAKDSGNEGGFYEKASAAEKCGAKLLVVKRPRERGINLPEAKKTLLRWKK